MTQRAQCRHEWHQCGEYRDHSAHHTNTSHMLISSSVPSMELCFVLFFPFLAYFWMSGYLSFQGSLGWYQEVKKKILSKMKRVLQVNFLSTSEYHRAFQEPTQQTLCCPLSCSSFRASRLPVKAKDTLFVSDEVCLPKYFLLDSEILETVFWCFNQ